MKKVLISTLVVAMCVGFGATALAVTPTPAVQQSPAFSDIAGHEAETALTLLGALGVYTGDAGLGGAVKPDDSITRAQFCKVVVTAMGRATTAAGLAGLQPTFTDGATIPTWAWGYVNVAVYMGIINGYADGSFKANNPVTYAESVTMLIRAVPGHLAQVTAGVWPYNYLFYGVDEGFAGGVDVGFANLPASRGDVAQMTVATMQKEKLDKDGEALPGTAQLYMYDDTVRDHSPADVMFGAAGWTDLAAKFWVVGAANLEGLRNLPVIYTYNAGDDVFFLGASGESNAVTGIFDSLDDADGDGPNDTIVLADGTTVPYADGGDVAVTWNQGDGYGLGALAAGDELVITLDDGGLAVNAQATHFEPLDYITSLAKSTAGPPAVDTGVDTYNGYSFQIPAACRVYLNGASSGRDTLAVDDAIVAAFINGTPVPFVLRANRVAAEGTVAGTTTTWPGPVSRATIDLKAGGAKTYVLNFDGGLGLPSKGDTVKYGLDFDGALYVPIGYETLTPYAVCRSYMVTGAGDYSATFDIRGQVVTYKLDGPLPLDIGGNCEWINTYCYLSVDTGTGTVIVGASVGDYSVDCCDYEVLSVDAVNGTLTIAEDGSLSDIIFWANPDFVVYKPAADGTLVYIGIEGLKVGDWVTGCLCYPDNPGCWPVATWIDPT